MLVMIDLDNTLADREAAVRSWIDEFCADWDLPADAPGWILEADEDGYADRSSVFVAIRSRFGLEPPPEALLGDYRRRVVELTAPTPGAVDCLRSLRSAGWLTAIVSNGSSGQQHAKIDALGLRGLVDAVCISGELGIDKPDPGIFEAAATAAGSTLEGAWMVGDSPHHDIFGAERLGVRTVWMRRGRTWTDAAARPTLTLDSLDELVPAITTS